MAQAGRSNVLTDKAIYDVWDQIEAAVSKVLDGVQDRRLLEFFERKADGAAFLQTVASDAIDRFEARRQGPGPMASLALVGGRDIQERGR